MEVGGTCRSTTGVLVDEGSKLQNVLKCTRQTPEQSIMQPKMLILLRLRNFALNESSETGTLLLFFYHGKEGWVLTSDKKASKERRIVVKS